MTAICTNHSGIEARMENLENSDKDQWDAIQNLRNKYDGVLIRTNAILATGLISLGVLILQFLFKK